MARFKICATRSHHNEILEGHDQSLVVLGLNKGKGLRLSVWERDGTLFYTVTEITATGKPHDPNIPDRYTLGNNLLTGSIGDKDD